MMSFEEVLEILDDVPDYRSFPTADEMRTNGQQLAQDHPDTVELLSMGQSRNGYPIEVLRIGDGPRTALLFAGIHPNEPIGGLMLEYWSKRLAEDDALRERLGYTWYLVKCIDPDGIRLNEGWFGGPFTLGNYARHYYRSPADQQVAWTFPIEYKTLVFDSPLPETRALMGLIEEVKPDFMYSLHNSTFSGVYFYIWDEAPPLYERFHRLVESQGLALHQGESERPYEVEYAKAIYKDNSITAEYDYLEAQMDTDPAEVITGGTLSFEYAMQFCYPFTLICEASLFYPPAIGDTTESETTYREVRREAIENTREDLALLRGLYGVVEDELSVVSPFRAAIEAILKSSESELAAEEGWLVDEGDRQATVAEVHDSLVVGRVELVLQLGMFMRMVAAQITATGSSTSLSTAYGQAREAFDRRAADIDAEMRYELVPIQKLVRLQLGSALLAVDYVAGRDENA